MKKDSIILVILLIAIVSVCGCINSPIDNINNQLSGISDDLTNGDNDFNDAVNSFNLGDVTSSNEKILSAINHYEDGEEKINEIEENEDKLNESIYKDYIDLIKEEISLKKNASENFKLALQYYNIDNSTCNNHIYQANSLMQNGKSMQNQRVEIVNDNPNKFKNKGFLG